MNRDRSLLEKGDSKRENTIDAVEAFFRGIVEKRREVTWDEMLKSG